MEGHVHVSNLNHAPTVLSQILRDQPHLLLVLRQDVPHGRSPGALQPFIGLVIIIEIALPGKHHGNHHFLRGEALRQVAIGEAGQFTAPVTGYRKEKLMGQGRRRLHDDEDDGGHDDDDDD